MFIVFQQTLARRSFRERNARNLLKTGGGKSYIITPPIGVVRKLGWKAHQKLTVRKYGEGILIRDRKKK